MMIRFNLQLARLIGLCLLVSQPFEDSAFGTWRYEKDRNAADSIFYNHLHRYGIHLDGPRRIAFPNTRVEGFPQEVYSGEHTLRLSNRNFKKGWLLTGKIFQDHLAGIRSWEKIPAELKFKSITWIREGNGSTAGITIHPSGEHIEADPSFGMGVYDIAFEVALRVPAFPSADKYYGISAFIIQ